MKTGVSNSETMKARRPYTRKKQINGSKISIVSKDASIVEIMIIVNQLKKTTESQEVMITTLKENLKQAEDRITNLETNCSSIHANSSPKPLFSNLFESKKVITPPHNNEVNILTAVANEQSDKDKREKCLVIMGIPTSNKDNKDEDDRKTVNDILRTIDIDTDKVNFIKRFKTKANSIHPGIIKIEVKEKAYKLSILKASKKLKDQGEKFKHIYINPDLTPTQQAAEKELIKLRNESNSKRKLSDKSKFYFGIRSGKIVKIDIEKASIQVNTINMDTESTTNAGKTIAQGGEVVTQESFSFNPYVQESNIDKVTTK